MSKLNLAPLAPFGAPPAPGSTSTNPGCTDPASQSYAPAPTDRASSRTPCSSPTMTSNGEIQLANQHLGNAAGGTVTVSAGSGAVMQSSGDGGQWLNRQKIVRATPTGQGLPRNIQVSDASQARHIPPEIAKRLPPAVNVAAGTDRPGRLPANVNIR